MSSSTQTILSLATIFLLLFFSAASQAETGKTQFNLAISFQPDKQILKGTARIFIPPDQDLTLFLTDLQVTNLVIIHSGGKIMPQDLPENSTCQIPAKDSKQEIFLSYNRTIKPDSRDNIIGHNGITLISNWHPIPSRPMTFQLTASLPEGFSAISGSNSPPQSANNEGKASFLFPVPRTALQFIAGPYIINKKITASKIPVFTCFFKEDSQLSKSYLQSAVTTINHYEQELGPFPYPFYAIVENRLPSGLAYPGFTLLGQAVIRLPFIKDTALIHEIVHSWFGNSVEVGPGGNWCEGLTSYLADHATAESRGKGIEYRKKILVDYLSYVPADNNLTLTQLTGAAHGHPLEKAARAILYGRAAMIFNELRGLIGPESFYLGLRQLYLVYKEKEATWKDIENTFTEVSEMNLETFFADRLDADSLVELRADNIQVTSTQDKTFLSFQLLQENPVTSLRIPLIITTTQGIIKTTVEAHGPSTEISIAVDDLPLHMVIDPNYDIMRRLSSAETPSSWSRFLGQGKKIIVVDSASKDKKIFQPFIKQMAQPDWIIRTTDEISNADLGTADLLFFGSRSAACRSLFGSPKEQPGITGFSLDVSSNPLNPEKVVVIMESSSQEETAAVAKKLSHYGRYSHLYFQHGQLKKKEKSRQQNGIHYVIENLPKGLATSAVNDFDSIMDKLNKARVLYVGETHNSYPDHLLQFRIIQAKFQRNPNLAIGMEMFPVSSQQVLDSYVLNNKDMTEKEFLKASNYFQVWRFDWRFYRDIFNFARKNHIPIIGLNLERSIVKNIFHTGHTDDLSAEQKKSLPVDRDLAMDGYSDRLNKMLGVHQEGGHGSGMLAGFVQSQGLWDETMAQTIADYLVANAEKHMVVLAGSQHTRKDSGIPPRVAGRIDVPQLVVANIKQQDSSSITQETDFVFFPQPLVLEPLGKIGIVLKPEEKDGRKFLRITALSPNSKAKDSGLAKDDIVLAINDYPITGMDDVQISMLDKQTGELISIRIQRARSILPDEEIEFEIELTDMTKLKPHP